VNCGGHSVEGEAEKRNREKKRRNNQTKGDNNQSISEEGGRRLIN